MSGENNSSNQNLTYSRRFRPHSLSGYIGNEKTKNSILKALNSSHKPQTLMLWGNTGCGKTTLARIIAREYSCENRDPVKGACGECAVCTEMEEYISTGVNTYLEYVHEIDISKNRGVQDLEEAINDMYLPAYGDAWKIYIFDECQMASNVLQNSLLKVVEEPPERVLIMFCTTNPEKMIDTLKNRCQLQLQIKKPSRQELVKLLESVCKVEDVAYDLKGLSLITNRADFVIRESLSKLEQVVREKGDAKTSSVLEVFEEVSDDILFEFYRALLNKDSIRFVTLIHTIKSTTGLENFVRSLEEFTKRGLYIINNAENEGLTESELKSYKALFSKFSAEKITMLLQKLLDFKVGDLETKLLLFGYTGLETSRTSSGVVSLDETLVVTQTDDIQQEQKETARNKSEHHEELVKNSLEVADMLVQTASTDDILEMFNADVMQK